MSEERFKKMDTIIDPFPIWDTVEEKGYNCTDTLDVLIDLLNNQNRELDNRKQIIKTLTQEYKELEVAHNESIKENERLKQGFNELLTVHTKVMQTLDNEFVSKALVDERWNDE